MIPICDSHVHIGQFHNIVESPVDIKNFVHNNGIDKIAVSSLSACLEDYDRLELEHKELEKILGDKVYSLLWLTPQMLKLKVVKKLLNSDINWKGFKIHGLQHKWSLRLIGEVIEIAQYYSLPIKFHSGGCNETDAGTYKELIRKNKNQLFILAHGRPLEQSIEILEDCQNVYVDTAFMPIENVRILLNHGFTEKILFGSDYPVFKYYYPKTTEQNYYLERISEISKQTNNDEFSKIMHKNFDVCYNC